MLRGALLYLSDQQRVFRFVRKNRLARSFANRFVAGETLTTALDAVEKLNGRGISASLDLLGESVHNEAEAKAAGREYLAMLDAIHDRQLDANVSVKLTAMGLDVSEGLCKRIMQDILDRAAKYSSFVRLDMEGSACTQRTLDLFEHHLFPCYREHVGIVLQSYLYRTFADVEHANRLHARVRICKGAYKEPDTVAYDEKDEVDRNYLKCMYELMLHGTYPGIATHDESIVREAKRYALENGIASSQYEFQMLYGVRRDLQHQLVGEGYRMRVYVPFGTQWYPYLMRRLAERPANVAFLTGSVVKEMISARRARNG